MGNDDLTKPVTPPPASDEAQKPFAWWLTWDRVSCGTRDELHMQVRLEEGWEVTPVYLRPSPTRDETIEMCAKVAENSVRQKCCGRGRIVCDARGEPISEDCCGEPDLEPMYPNEIAEAIRALKSTPDAGGEMISVPEGWKLVPVEPTSEMIEAGTRWERACDNCGGTHMAPESCYRAMLSASPSKKGE